MICRSCVTSSRRFEAGSQFSRYRQGVAAPVFVVTSWSSALLDMPAAARLYTPASSYYHKRSLPNESSQNGPLAAPTWTQLTRAQQVISAGWVSSQLLHDLQLLVTSGCRSCVIHHLAKSLRKSVRQLNSRIKLKLSWHCCRLIPC
jgi:hypothetical protein